MNLPKISVVIPMYNVEQYIEKCAVSLLNQTLDDVEYIFVDDCSNDNSLLVLKTLLLRFPQRVESVKIISQCKNEGVVKARYEGLNCAKGEYVIFCDSDDWVEFNMFETLYNFAANYQSDIVVFDFWEESDSFTKRYSHVDINKTIIIQDLIQGNVPGYLWNKLIKRELLFNIKHPFFRNIWEDLYMNIQLFRVAKKVDYCSMALYHYRTFTQNSLSSKMNKDKFYSMVDNIRAIEKIVSDDDKSVSCLLTRKIYCKLLMITFKIEANLWNSIFPESYVSLLKARIPIHLKMMAWLLERKQMFLYEMLFRLKTFLKG